MPENHIHIYSIQRNSVCVSAFQRVSTPRKLLDIRASEIIYQVVLLLALLWPSCCMTSSSEGTRAKTWQIRQSLV